MSLILIWKWYFFTVHFWMPIENRKKDTQKVLKTNSSCSPLASERRHSSPSITGGPAASLTTSLPVMATPLLDDLTSVCVWVRIRRAFQYRSVCGRARGSRAAPGQARARARVGARPRARRPRLASARSAPDKLASTPGTLRTTAGGGPRACQSALPPPLCPTHKHSRGAERTFIHRFLGGRVRGGWLWQSAPTLKTQTTRKARQTTFGDVWLCWVASP